MAFEWDSAKNQTNIGKHGVSFEAATTSRARTSSIRLACNRSGGAWSTHHPSFSRSRSRLRPDDQVVPAHPLLVHGQRVPDAGSVKERHVARIELDG